MRHIIVACAGVLMVMLASAGAGAQDRSVGEKIDDAAITAKVKAKLVSERPGNLTGVDVDTENGVVHLQGTVPTADDKMAAERITALTEGVSAVRNDLLVQGTAPVGSQRGGQASSESGRTFGEKVDDGIILTKVKTKLVGDRLGNLASVNVDVRDAVVTLEGKVPTAEDKLAAERLARGTDGVRAVSNQLVVEGTELSPSASPRQ